MAPGALGAREPADPGTTIKARRLWGVALPAVPYPRFTCKAASSGRGGRFRDVFVTVGTSFQYHAGAATRTLSLDRPVDLRFVLGPLVRGAGDPTIRVAEGAAIRASVTPDGPGTIEIRLDGPEVHAWAWGPGAAHILDGVPGLLGVDDDDSGFEPAHHPVVASLARRRGRVTLGRTGAVWEALLPAMLEQRITGTEAWRNYRRLVRAHGMPAPGPLALWLPPTPRTIAALPSFPLTAPVTRLV